VSKQTTTSRKGHQGVYRLTRACRSRWKEHRTKYTYDALGRITNRAINGISQQVTFDALHRVTLVTNVLGRFTNLYVGGTMLVSTNLYPNGQKTIFSYLTTPNDERLSEIWNKTAANATISKFDYTYDSVGNMMSWTQQTDANAATVYGYGYDAGNQILSAVLQSTGVGATVLKQYAYGYDLAGNRTSEQIDTGMSLSSFNNVNQLTTRTAGSGSMQFAGSLSEQATVTVGGNSASVNHATSNFLGYANVSSGTNVIPVSAADYNNNARTNKYQVLVTNNGVAKTITFDLNGNESSVVTATSTNSYQWDAANRMVSLTGPTNQSIFTYDGLGRRVQIVELYNGVAYVTNKYVWAGKELVEQRDLTGSTVVKRFFGGGEQISGTSYFFTRDHLGSIREMVNSAGTIQARYDYDPYGRRTKISGSLDADFGYAGMYQHASSGLNLTLFRAYDSDLGRWLNRDPIHELGGLNLYDYVGNNPINEVDLFGLVGYGGGNPVSGPWGAGGPSSPYAPGGYLAPTYSTPPLFNSSFSFGLTVQVSGEYGYAAGMGANYNFGFGLFYNPNDGFSLGGFHGGGAFFGNPSASFNIPCHSSDNPSGAFGAYGGAGLGPWISNAGSPSDLGGPFNQWNINSPVSASYASSGGTWIGSLTYGPGDVASFSTYPTTTTSAGGFRLLTGQPDSYSP